MPAGLGRAGVVDGLEKENQRDAEEAQDAEKAEVIHEGREAGLFLKDAVEDLRRLLRGVPRATGRREGGGDAGQPLARFS